MVLDSSPSRLSECRMAEEDWVVPFDDAFDEGTGTCPYGSMSKVASSVASPQGTIIAALRLARLGPADVFIDLGCGAGTVVRLASEFGCRLCLGVDISPALIQEAVNNSVGQPVQFECANIFRVLDPTNLRSLASSSAPQEAGATPASSPLAHVVLYLYQVPAFINRTDLRDALRDVLRLGCRIVTVFYHIRGACPSTRDDLMNVELLEGAASLP
jgi:SAM-dependent methyltransferase